MFYWVFSKFMPLQNSGFCEIHTNLEYVQNSNMGDPDTNRRLFHQNINFMKISFQSYQNANEVIATAQLPWHVQKIVAIWWPGMELQ